ncbi:MAG: trypsin-like peptidase domain-containing protein [Holosporales bacterium]|jgi:serine protease Do|nr:trypsin-like peptidase domain-containing protein [Holosporales bacterium]
MRFFWLVKSAGVAVVLITVWECFRGDIGKILPVFHEGEKTQSEKASTPPEEKKAEDDDATPKTSEDPKPKEEASDKPTDDSKEGEEKQAANSSEVAPVINFEKGLEDIANMAMNSVVNVATMQLIEDQGQMGFPDFFGDGPFDQLFKDFFDFPRRKARPKKAHALGSGFIVKIEKDKAYIVTNNHVIEKAKKIVVFLSDKKELPAELYASDPRTDIAVLSVDIKGLDLNTVKMTPIKWGDSDKLNAGNFVVAIGNPFGLGSTVTHGIVSAKERNFSIGAPSSLIEEFIQHSAPINMGNSGGCLLNTKGEVIGINTAIYTPNGGSVGVGFAIPANTARPVVEKLLLYKVVTRGWLGVEVHPVTREQAVGVGLAEERSVDRSQTCGAFVSKVSPGSPAAAAGLKPRDIIIEVDGKRVSDQVTLPKAISAAVPGKKITIKVWRQKDSGKWGEVPLVVEVGDYERALETGALGGDQARKGEGKGARKETSIDPLGISVMPISEENKYQHPDYVRVIVTSVDDSGSSFAGSPFQPGDGIVQVNNAEITSVKQLESTVNQCVAKGIKSPITIIIIRGGALIMTSVPLIYPSEKSETEKPPKK